MVINYNISYLMKPEKIQTLITVLQPCYHTYEHRVLTSSRRRVTASMSLYVLVIWPTRSAHKTEIKQVIYYLLYKKIFKSNITEKINVCFSNNQFCMSSFIN